MAQLCKHSPNTIGDIASNHHRQYPLDPYVIVMTLEPVDSLGCKIHSPTQIRCITIREHQDIFDPLECLPLLDPCKEKVSIWLRPIFLAPWGGTILSLGLSHSFSWSTLAFTLSFVLSGMLRIVLKRASATFFSVCITSMLWGSLRSLK